MIKCPHCGSKRIMSHMLMNTFAFVDLNSYEVDDDINIDTLEFEPADVTEADCFSCNSGFKINTKVVDGKIVHEPVGNDFEEVYKENKFIRMLENKGGKGVAYKRNENGKMNKFFV